MAADMLLDDRKVTILKAIIKTYLETGEPVGSRTISKYSDLKLSSAASEVNVRSGGDGIYFTASYFCRPYSFR